MFTPEQQNEIIKRRHEIVLKYCEELGWNPDELSMEQIMRIRSQKNWKEVPQQAIKLDLSQFEGTYTVDDAKKVADTLKGAIGILADVHDMSDSMAFAVSAMHSSNIDKEVILVGTGGHHGRTVLHHKANSGAIVVVNPTIPLELMKPTEPMIFKPAPALKPDPASIKSGKQLRRERRKDARKKDKRKNKK